MPEETNINPTPPAPEPPATTTPEPIIVPAAPTEPIPAPIVTPVPEPVAPVVPPTPISPPNPLLSKGGGTDVRSLLDKALAKIQFRKQAKLEKIMVLAKSKGQVTNDDAQKLLRVSDATATRYLAALVKSGRLQRTGVRVYRFVQ